MFRFVNEIKHWTTESIEDFIEGYKEEIGEIKKTTKKRDYYVDLQKLQELFSKPVPRSNLEQIANLVEKLAEDWLDGKIQTNSNIFIKLMGTVMIINPSAHNKEEKKNA